MEENSTRKVRILINGCELEGKSIFAKKTTEDAMKLIEDNDFIDYSVNEISKSVEKKSLWESLLGFSTKDYIEKQAKVVNTIISGSLSTSTNVIFTSDLFNSNLVSYDEEFKNSEIEEYLGGFESVIGRINRCEKANLNLFYELTLAVIEDDEELRAMFVKKVRKRYKRLCRLFYERLLNVEFEYLFIPYLYKKIEYIDLITTVKKAEKCSPHFSNLTVRSRKTFFINEIFKKRKRNLRAA